MDSYAVIGLGNISKRHRKNLKVLHPEAKIYALSASGRQPKEPIEFADEVVISLAALIKCKPKLVVVASPATYHAEHAIPLIEAGIPVLIEKPISASVIDSQKIIIAADKYDVPVGIGYCLRYLSSTRYLKDELEKKIVGDLRNVFIEIGQYLPDWRPTKNYRNSVSAKAELGGGALLELSHELDYAQWLLGPFLPECAILRSSKELDLSVEDSVDILALNKQGTVISIHLDFLQKPAHRRCRILGSEGNIEWDLINNQVILIADNEKQLIFDGKLWDKNQMYLDMLLDFESLIAKQPNACITAKEAENTILLIDEIKQKALIRKNLK